ncbi:helix-turn-helix domain-containing protein [Elizabethkingia anophelis]|uniref:helix-turn-helix domain-containing protein n=1 Tax=Elizabethkingia anophelis TaxID=1117645 RepID=UPI0038911DBF
MDKLLQHRLFKHDLFSIDRFISRYGDLGVLHPNIGVKMTFYDCIEERKISEEEFETTNDFQRYFVNYNEVLPLFDIGLFQNMTAQIFADCSYDFRMQLKKYLLSIKDATTKKINIYEVKRHFIDIGEILSALKTLDSTNIIQKEAIALFLEQYQDEICYLDGMYMEYFKPHSGEAEMANNQVLKSILDRMIAQKIEGITLKLNSIDERISEEVLSIKEARKFLGLTETTFWRMRKGGVVKEYMMGSKTYFKKSELLDLLVPTN